MEVEDSMETTAHLIIKQGGLFSHALIEDVLNQLGHSEWFSALDL
jgi:hypothetical protein